MNHCEVCGAPAIHYLEFTRRIAGYLCTTCYMGTDYGRGSDRKAWCVPPSAVQDYLPAEDDPVGVVARRPLP